nr:unnamed protein product [Callosobruchus chinensis]
MEKSLLGDGLPLNIVVATMAHVGNDELLISLVEQCAHLYDKASKNYKDERLKENAWKSIAEKLKTERKSTDFVTSNVLLSKTPHIVAAAAKQRWVNLKDRFFNVGSDGVLSPTHSIEVPELQPNSEAGPGPQRGTPTTKRKKTIHESMNVAISRERVLVHHLKVTNTLRKTTKKDTSRRLSTITYHLTKDKKPVIVCKKLFLSTLGISERMRRTALIKLNEMGVMKKDKRGGRQRNKENKEKEAYVRFKIEEDIDRFPKVEFHFCRAKTSKMYLHPDLSLHKMYFMFLEDLKTHGSKLYCSYHTYRRGKRKRDPNPSFDESTKLISLIRKYFETVENKNTDAVSVPKKMRFWKEFEPNSMLYSPYQGPLTH